MEARIKGLKLVVNWLCVLSMLLFVPGIATAGSGKSGATFLKIGAGVRPAGLGDAFVALADDANSLYWNPAGLTQLKKKEITGMHMEWLSDFSYQFVGAAVPFGKLAVGLSFIRNATQPFPEIDSSGNQLENLDVSDMAIGVSAAYAIIKGLSFGVSSRMVLQTLAGKNASAIVFDIGGLYKLSERLQIGINTQNIGEQSQPFGTEKDPMPMLIRAGVAAQAFKTDKNKLNVAVAVTQPQDGSELTTHLGAEMWISDRIGLRAGYKIGSMLDKFTLGASLKLAMIQIDFAYIPFEELDTTYRVGATLQF